MRLVILVMMLTGCVSWSQYRYTGTGNSPVIKEHPLALPQNPNAHTIVTASGSGVVFDYFAAPAQKIVNVANPLDTSIVVAVKCNVETNSVVRLAIPAHTQQDFTIDTTGRYVLDTLCSINAWAVKGFERILQEGERE